LTKITGVGLHLQAAVRSFRHFTEVELGTQSTSREKRIILYFVDLARKEYGIVDL
jgi:hypothetical protein